MGVFLRPRYRTAGCLKVPLCALLGGQKLAAGVNFFLLPRDVGRVCDQCVKRVTGFDQCAKRVTGLDQCAKRVTGLLH